MLRSRVFWRLLLAYCLLIAAAASAVGMVAARVLSEQLEADLQRRLAGQAAVLAPFAARALADGDPSVIRAALAAIERADGQPRITLIAADGSVLVDSDRDPTQIGNQASRPEFVAAIAHGWGASRRSDDAGGGATVYFARRLAAEGRPLGVVRVSMPLADVQSQVAAVRGRLLTVALLALLGALVPSVFIARRFTAPIADLTRVSEALRRGRYDARVGHVGTDELGVLGENLNRLADELRERIERVSKQGAQLNAILRGMQEGVVALAADGSVAFGNRSAKELLGLAPEADAQALRATIASLAPLAALLRRLEETKAPGRCELSLGEGDRERVLDVRATPFADGSERGVLLVLYNVTHLRRLERVRTDFVANVSHELKTPLTSILGYVETLLDGAVHDPHNNVRFLEKIQQQVRRLSALVSDLLSLARIEAPARAATPPLVDWREVVTEAAARWRDPIDRKRLELTIDCCGEPLVVRADPEDLRQILDNLLDNAISYTPAGGAICVRVGRDAAHGVLEVADTGIGIPREALGRIFERFYRVERGRSRELGGTGLGLSIVRNLVRRLGGTVSVDSRVGAGSTFTVRLPLGAAREPIAEEV